MALQGSRSNQPSDPLEVRRCVDTGRRSFGGNLDSNVEAAFNGAQLLQSFALLESRGRERRDAHQSADAIRVDSKMPQCSIPR